MLPLPNYASPRDVGIVYDEWRPQQLESINWLRNTKYTRDGKPIVKITEQATGSGKSALAMATNDGKDADFQTIVLTHTRNLQHQYASVFPDCFVHKGKNNYDCLHPDNPRGELAKADDCIYPGKLRECPFFPCPYYESKQRSRRAPRVSLNYAYWFTAREFYASHYLMLDEAHSLSDLVLEHVGMTITERERQRWDLPEFPELIEPAAALFTDAQDAPHAAIDWLMVAANKLEASHAHYQHLIDRTTGKDQIEAIENERATKRAAEKYNGTLDALAGRPGEHWFIRAGMDYAFYRGQAELAMVIKPLTARYDFAKFFLSATNRQGDPTRVALMSATIGNLEAFTEELGIYPYDARIVPSQWGPQQRPVYILDAPSMGRKNTRADERAFDKQADVIAKAIKEQPPEWSGLILVTRKAEVLMLSERLAKRGLAKRIYPMVRDDLTYTPTDIQVQEWEQRKRQVPNSIGVSASLWTGYDGKYEKILIVAKCAFPYIGDPYERARMYYSGKTFLWRTACTMEQGLGRTRRGNPEDYDTEDTRNGFVAIADADYQRLKSYTSQGLQEAMIRI